MSQQENETFEIQSMDMFADLLAQWHKRRVETLEHFFEVPEGTEVEITMQDGVTQKHIIAGDIKTGFLIGLNLALMELGTLPFLVENRPQEEATTQPEETLSGQVAG